jgi:hypothetical protein
MDTLTVDPPSGCSLTITTEKLHCDTLTTPTPGAHLHHRPPHPPHPSTHWHLTAPAHTHALAVHAPAKFNFVVKGGDGEVVIGDVEGEVSVETQGGAVAARGRVQGVRTVFRTAGGDVALGSIDGDLEVQVGDGAVVRAERVSGLHVRVGALKGCHVDIASLFCDTLAVQLGEGSSVRLGAVLCREGGSVRGQASKVTIGSVEIGEGKSFHVEAKGPINAHIARDKACSFVANSAAGAVSVSVDAGVKVKLVKPVASVADDVHQMPKSSREPHTILLDLRSGLDHGTSVHHKTWLERHGFSEEAKSSKKHH